MLAAVLALGVLVPACDSPLRGTASPMASHPHVNTTEPPTALVPTTSAPSTTVPSTAAQACNSNLAGQLASTGQATQLIVVDAPTYATTDGDLSAFQRHGPCWVAVFGPWTARIGAAGFSDHHIEGDDTTPTGDFGIGSVMYGNAPNPGVHYPYHQLVCGDWWDEDPRSLQYNTFQYVPCGEAPPFGGDSEALWQETTAYPSFAVIDYNTYPVVPGAGSGIFIHADLGAPTTGCISLPLDELEELLRWLNPSDTPIVLMGPDSEIEKF
jgi:L,D-peptidoglycan transpeptidase YkuD (ErfK/YbiS/YcfS/YnhG family)